MGKRERYTPGTLSWVDLATTDAAGAKRFYGDLMGWTFDDQPVPDGGVYSMAMLDGDSVCALYDMSPQMRERGAPPNWLSYVTVESADAAAARAKEAGGTAHSDAFDVMDAGRMAVLQDPAGAVLGVWEPRGSIGATRVNDVGCLCINELATTDLDGAAAFYGDLFGWDVEVVDTGPGGPPYRAVRIDGNLNANMTVTQGDAPPHWRPYFTVASLDGALARIPELGGRAIVGPIDIPAGRFGMAFDGQGAFFCLFEGDVDP